MPKTFNITPGPWSADSAYSRYSSPSWVSFRVRGPDGLSICAASSNTKRVGIEVKANAKLIEQAPNLLAAALYALAALDPDASSEIKAEAVKYIEATIAKVKVQP